MALALIFIGLILVVSAIKGTHSELSSLLASEFSGAGNFWYFIIGLIFLGSLAYIPALRNTSRGLIALTLVVLMLTNGGFWNRLMEAANNPQSIAAKPPESVPDAVDVEQAGKALGTGVAQTIGKLAVDNAIGGAGGGAVGAGVSAVIGILSGIL